MLNIIIFIYYNLRKLLKIFRNKNTNKNKIYIISNIISNIKITIKYGYR